MTTLASRVAMACAFVVGVSLSGGAVLSAERRHAPPPVCASRSDPALARTRDAVRAAARARSFPMLREVLAPTVTYLLFDQYTPDGFVAAASHWPAQQQDSFWDAVSDVLALPLVVRADGDDPPTAISYTRMADYPDEGWVLITGRRVRVRSQPSAQAPTVAHLSHQVVPRWDAGPPHDDARGDRSKDFVPVQYDGTRRGWVNAGFTAGPLDFAVVFEKAGGEWKVVNFTMGD
jgi:hypothetical protein